MNAWGRQSGAWRFPFSKATRCVVALAVLVICTSHAALAQSAPAAPAPSPLHFQISTPKTTYHVGEVIPIELTFSADVPGAFRIQPAPASQTAPFLDDVILEPAEVASANNAIAGVFFGRRAAPPKPELLTPTPKHFSLILNPRITIKQPGTVKLRFDSKRVVADLEGDDQPPAFPLTSNTLTIEIVPATPEWQAAELADVRSILDKTAPLESPNDASPRAQAIQRLSYLDSDASARELTRLYANANDYELALFSEGLVRSTRRGAALDEANRLLEDPDFGVSSAFADLVETLPASMNGDAGENVQTIVENEKELSDKLADALPSKRGKAFAMTLATMERLTVAEDDGSKPNAPNQAVARAVPQLIRQFGQLSPAEQQTWLSQNWSDVKDPSWIPVVRSLALAQVASVDAGVAVDTDKSQTAGIALSDWVELDPAGARHTMLTEITSANPHFDAGTLAMLPDDTLPAEAQRQIGERFLAAADLATAEHFAALIARYGDKSVWPAVSGRIAQSIGGFTCETQIALLDFAMSVAPDDSESLLNAESAPPQDAAVDCRSRVMSEISPDTKKHAALLEKIALRELDDPDRGVVTGAADYLSWHGSPETEDALLQRYQTWAADWAVQVRNAGASSEDIGADAYLLVGQELARALTHGRAWLANTQMMERIRGMVDPQFAEIIIPAYDLERASESPLVISCTNFGPQHGFSVAQYNTADANELKEKLAQFPGGTTFYWNNSRCDDQNGGPSTFNDVASTASLSGITVKPAPPNVVADSSGADGSSEEGDPLGGPVVADRLVVVN